MRDVALQLLEFLFRENLHEVVDVQQDAIEVDAVDGRREEADHPPQTLHTRGQVRYAAAVEWTDERRRNRAFQRCAEFDGAHLHDQFRRHGGPGCCHQTFLKQDEQGAAHTREGTGSLDLD